MPDPFADNPVPERGLNEKTETFDLLFILKDEAKTIEGVIKSFWDNGKPLYQKLIIGVDKATTDDTFKIVESYANKLFRFDFKDDFSAARNLVIDWFEKNSDSDWAIFPDGHEYLCKESIPLLKLILESNSFQNTHVITPYFSMIDDVYCCVNQCSVVSLPSYIFCRPIMLRRGKGRNFADPIHNYLYAPYPHTKLIPEFMLEHKMPPKRLTSRKKQRKQMNLTGLREKVKKNPKDTRAVFYLAQTYGDQGDFKQAIRWYKRYFKISDFQDELSEAQLTCAQLMNALGQHKDATKILALAILTRWDRAEVYFELGSVAFQKGKYEEAVHWFEICTRMKFPVTHYFIRPNMYNWAAYDALMEGYSHLKDYRKSLQCAYRVKHWKPDCNSVKKNIEILEGVISKGDQAIVENVPPFTVTDVKVE